MTPADGHLIELVKVQSTVLDAANDKLNELRSQRDELNRENERLHAELDTLKVAHSGCVRTYWPYWSTLPPAEIGTVTVTYAPNHPLCYVTPNGSRQTFTLGHLATDGNA